MRDRVHPDVTAALQHTEAVKERLYAGRDKITQYVGTRTSDDKDIAIKVGAYGQLIDIWFKPGITSRKPIKDIEKQVNVLLAQACANAAETTAKIYAETKTVHAY